MNISLIQTVMQSLEQGSPLTFVIVFWAAAILSLSSCTIIRVPVVIGFIGGASDSKKKAFLLTLSFVSALVLSYTLLGVFFGLASGLAANMIKLSRYFYYIIGAFAFFIGIQMAGLVNFNFIQKIVSRMPMPKQKGMMGAFLFGLLFVLFESPTCPCCGPVLFMIAGFTFAKGKFVYAILLFFTYALGQSLPILLVGTFTSIVKYIRPATHGIEKVAALVGGNMLIALALYLFLLG